MTCDATGDLIQPPADRPHLMSPPCLRQGMCPEHHKQIVRQHTDAEEHGIGCKLTGQRMYCRFWRSQTQDELIAFMANIGDDLGGFFEDNVALLRHGT